jgi:hypothetical protein
MLSFIEVRQLPVGKELDKLQNPDSEANLQLDNKCETFRKQYRFANNYSKRGKR